MSRHIDLPCTDTVEEDYRAGVFYPLRVAWEEALERKFLHDFFSPEANSRAWAIKEKLFRALFPDIPLKVVKQ